MSKEWAAAFAKAQAEFPAIHKGKTVDTGSFSYKYADLPSILEAVNPILKDNGLAIGQAVISDEARVGVETRIYHTSGHVEVFGPLFLHGGSDAKSAGSAVTYARRYSLCAALGIATDEDDDGASASSAPSRSRSEPQNESEPHCPACRVVNGEIVGVYENDKAPYWKCKNKPSDCAGAAEDKNGKLWSWSGWDPDWERSAAAWLHDNGHGATSEPVKSDEAEWLAVAVKALKLWQDEERRAAYKQAMEELKADSLDSMETAKTVFEMMAARYYAEHPTDDGAPF